MKKIDFNKWFEAQFGPRPEGDIVELREEIAKKKMSLNMMEDHLRALQMYENRRAAAFLAKNAIEDISPEFEK